ncbi:UPF0755 protein [Alkalibaculum bacchi]|uniref:Endolytic murein transglycosylase n=1 Tax=Alkalibaculum bacchi TaxID=645887 RepID=A0A366IEP8_9FIRM|nr:endolytic transglycosylase MltG [Alkalibaculum bacchi]RBP68388.1 UPF0755 protein [Alkalibaculum bacchi]
MKDKKRKMLLLLLLIIVSIGAFILYYYNSIKPLNRNGEEKLVEIPSGYSLMDIADLLEDAHIIKDKLSLKIYAITKGYAGQIKAGKYILSPSYSVGEIVEKIARGETARESIVITIPEGWNLSQIGEALEKNELVSKDEFIKETNNIAKYQEEFPFLSGIKNIEERSLEGYLFPDTYYFYKEDDSEIIIRKMLSRFGQILKPEYEEQAESLNMTIDDIVILTSIVEQETKYPEDRPKVAEVFYNRLEINKPLQSDITVLYALGVKKERVLYKDLEVESKYNTYKYPGLPIGPVGSFSEAALKATLYPDDNDYLYFLAKPDGYCVFNETFEEHDVDVNKYLR